MSGLRLKQQKRIGEHAYFFYLSTEYLPHKSSTVGFKNPWGNARRAEAREIKKKAKIKHKNFENASFGSMQAPRAGLAGRGGSSAICETAAKRAVNLLGGVDDYIMTTTTDKTT